LIIKELADSSTRSPQPQALSAINGARRRSGAIREYTTVSGNRRCIPRG